VPELCHARPGGDASHGRDRGRLRPDGRVEVALTVLVLGIGNPGRRDDGLGPKLAEVIGEGPGVRSEFRYQLSVEDALAIRDCDAVIFADASRAGEAAADLTPIEADAGLTFTTHALAPAAVLSLCRELYGRTPRAWMLAIRGYDWEVGEGLSEGAERNLAAALALLNDFIASLQITARRAKAVSLERKS